jgi:hypothetical protein
MQSARLVVLARAVTDSLGELRGLELVELPRIAGRYVLQACRKRGSELCGEPVAAAEKDALPSALLCQADGLRGNGGN